MLRNLESGQYRAILESLPTGVYVVDQARRILFWNDGAEQLTGYLRHEVIGRSCFDDMLMHCDEENRILCGRDCPLLGTMKDGQLRESVIYLRHKDGQRIPVRVRAVPIRDEMGQIVGAAETFDEAPPNLDMRAHPHAEATRKRLEEAGTVGDTQCVRKYIAACLRDFSDDGISFGVLWAAIDNLDQFTLLHGAQAADKALSVAGATIAKNLRADDVVGQSEDKRFVLVIPNCTAAVLERTALKMKRIVSAATVRWWGNSLAVSLSAAGVISMPGDTVDALLERSRRAFNQAVCTNAARTEVGLRNNSCSQ